ncbi:ATP-dependent DNA helicase Q-like 4A, partial [Linum grandiflorum]
RFCFSFRNISCHYKEDFFSKQNYKEDSWDLPSFLLHPSLELADPHPAAGGAVSFVADFHFTLVNQFNRSGSSKTMEYDRRKRSWEFDEAIWVEFPRDGFLIDDTLIFEAQFCETLTGRVYNDLLVLRNVVNEECDVGTPGNYRLGDTTLQKLSKRMPRTKKDLLCEHLIRTKKVSKYGDRILQTIASAVEDYNRKEGSCIRGYGTICSAKRKTGDCCFQSSEMAPEDKFIWRIENFSTLTVTEPEIHSPTFSLMGHQWKIRLLPKDRMSYMSAYLELDDSKTTVGVSSLVADCRLAVVNQLNRTLPLETTFIMDYNQTSRSWNIINRSSTWARDEFLVKDTLIFEAQISKSLPARVYSDLLALRTLMNEESCLSTAANYILGDTTLETISRRIPRTKEELQQVNGIGIKKLSKYGDQILQTIASAVEDYNGEEGNGTSDSAKRKCEPAQIGPLEAINDSTENQEPEVIELDPHDQFGRSSASPPLSNKVARTSTIMSPSNVRSARIAQLSTMASCWKSTSVDVFTNDASHGSALPQEQRQKLAKFFKMLLESICQANWSGGVREVVLKMTDLATDPTEKKLLKDLLSRLVEFSSSTLESLSMVETSSEGNLLQRRNQLKLLNSQVSRNKEDQLKVDAEIQQLLARKDKLVRERNSALAEMKELAEHEQARCCTRIPPIWR